MSNTRNKTQKQNRRTENEEFGEQNHTGLRNRRL